jgi:hypothetical protein
MTAIAKAPKLMKPAIRGGEVPPVKNAPGGGEGEVGAAEAEAGDKGMKVVVVVVVGGGAGFTSVDAPAAEVTAVSSRGNRIEGAKEEDMAGGQEDDRLDSLRGLVTFRPMVSLLLTLKTKNSDKG